MSSFYDTTIRNDFVWDAILMQVGGSGRSGSGFVNICCPMCVHMGEPSPDTKYRCGIRNNTPGVGVHCFRCGFKTRWMIGDTINGRLRWFMSVLGIDDKSIKRLNLLAVQYRRVLGGGIEEGLVKPFRPSFSSDPLPQSMKKIIDLIRDGETNPDFIATVEYIANERGHEFLFEDFYWTPEWVNRQKMSRRFVIPAIYSGMNVGWVARSIDDNIRSKYINHLQPNFLLNNHLLEEKGRRTVFLAEGALDAIAIGGISPLGAKLNDNQIKWIRESGKEVIVVPDVDGAGSRLVDVALENKWKVSFPNVAQGGGRNLWDSNVKDAAEAMKKYGRLYVVRSLLEATTHNPTEIKMKQRIIQNRFKNGR